MTNWEALEQLNPNYPGVNTAPNRKLTRDVEVFNQILEENSGLITQIQNLEVEVYNVPTLAAIEEIKRQKQRLECQLDYNRKRLKEIAYHL